MQTCSPPSLRGRLAHENEEVEADEADKAHAAEEDGNLTDGLDGIGVQLVPEMIVTGKVVFHGGLH